MRIEDFIKILNIADAIEDSSLGFLEIIEYQGYPDNPIIVCTSKYNTKEIKIRKEHIEKAEIIDHKLVFEDGNYLKIWKMEQKLDVI